MADLGHDAVSDAPVSGLVDTAPPADVPYGGWYKPLDEPARKTITRPEFAIFMPYQEPVVVPSENSWFGALSEPLRARPLRYTPSTFAPISFATPIVTGAFGEPLRVRPLRYAPQAYTPIDFAVPRVVPGGAFSEPPRAKPVL